MASAAPKIFYPRLIVQWVQLGLKERVLLSDDIWLCAFCYQCHERCPQGLSLPEIWLVLRNLAVERGHIPERPAFLVKNLIKSGRTLHMSEGTDDWREAAGLPRVGLTIPEKTLAEIRSIVKTTGFDKKLKLGEE